MPATAQAPGLARRAAREVLRAWQLGQLEDTALLLVSELVTNAARHAVNGEQRIVLRLETAGNGLRIEVQDGDSRWPRPGTPGGLDESGFGLVLVNALASSWGVIESDMGKAVWAELQVPGPPAG